MMNVYFVLVRYYVKDVILNVSIMTLPIIIYKACHKDTFLNAKDVRTTYVPPFLRGTVLVVNKASTPIIFTFFANEKDLLIQKYEWSRGMGERSSG
jgi:hypothetical protein